MKAFLLSFLTLLSLAGISQLVAEKKSKQLKKHVSEQLDTKKSPGLAVGIVYDGEVVFEEYVGYADLKKGIRLGRSSRFNYASSGKQFTALAILRLVEEGKVKLEDDIRKYLPDFYPALEEKIQIQHLLTHTSGVRDVYDLWSLQGITWWEESFGNKEAMDLLREQEALNFTPGSSYSYSNSNYLLLAEVVEKISSQSFKSYSDNLFNYLGLPNTAFENDHNNIEDRVLPYGFWKKYRMYEWNPDLIGDGALFTTLEDQLSWERMIQESQDPLISKSQQTIPSSSIDTYGFGLEFDGDKAFHHGSTGAYGATFSRYPNEKLSIVVMSNYTNISTSSIADQCYEILTGNQPEEKASRSPETVGSFVAVKDLLGTYKTPGGYYYRFIEKNDTLFLERTNREPVALEHEEGNIYHEINDPDFQLEFTNHPELGQQITAYYPTHDSYTLTKSSINWGGYNYMKLNGTYQNTELDVSFDILYLQDDEYKITMNGEYFTIQIFEPDVIWVGNYKILAEMNGSQLALLVNSGRNQNMLFSKVD